VLVHRTQAVARSCCAWMCSSSWCCPVSDMADEPHASPCARLRTSDRSATSRCARNQLPVAIV
jgi:hypothetical protein